ncbi:hypothetical protein DE146DRAFT_421057 [Phaeosphaeria sp. MPI-PUGE-AT-0046c]|nr:hypothetical protein DE146DRAFT_421057 [Phaeosphaeria sp. MPI-PUGE-AT-0046c]
MRFFLPRTWRLSKVVYFLMLFELPFTVANLALFGIASPNLYRTILWRLGGEMGFNSHPQFLLYAYANYRPVTIPVVWSSFNTQFHLVIGVICMFFWLIKITMWLLKVFLPIFSLLLHSALLGLWAYGIHMQTAPDTIDPAHQNKGVPWYISKNCKIVESKIDQGYCMQAKSAFAVSLIMLTIYACFLILTIYSLIPTTEARQSHATKQAEKKAEKEKWANSPVDNEMTAEEQWQHMWELQQLPRTPGTVGGMKSPMTPRTRTFQDLEGGHGQVQYSNLQPSHGGYYNGDVSALSVSPLAEQDEYLGAGKGKQHQTGAAY